MPQVMEAAWRRTIFSMESGFPAKILAARTSPPPRPPWCCHLCGEVVVNGHSRRFAMLQNAEVFTKHRTVAVRCLVSRRRACC